jgi:hypothetical protein
MKLKMLALALAGTVLYGCNSTPTIKANVTSKVSNNSPVSLDTPLGVFVAKGGNEDVTKLYIDHVVTELKNQGYTNVHSAEQLKQSNQGAQVAVLVNIDKKETMQKVYAPRRVGGQTRTQTCSSSGTSQTTTCTTSVSQAPTVERVPELVKMTGSYFATSWVDVNSKRELAYFLTTTFDDKCDESSTFNALISDSMSRIDLSKKQSQQHEVKIKLAERCQ